VYYSIYILLFIALVGLLIDIKLPIFNGGANRPRWGGESARGKQAKRWISQGAKELGGERARGQISQGAKKPGAETVKGQRSQTLVSWLFFILYHSHLLLHW